MENKKQEAIEKAYGEHWETVKEYVDKNGYCVAYWNICELIGYSKPKSEGTKWRPISIKNLETNEGWISILPDGSNLPIADDSRDLLFFVGTMFDSGFQQRGGLLSATGVNSVWPYEKFSHYQPIERPKQPIY